MSTYFLLHRRPWVELQNEAGLTFFVEESPLKNKKIYNSKRKVVNPESISLSWYPSEQRFLKFGGDSSGKKIGFTLELSHISRLCIVCLT